MSEFLSIVALFRCNCDFSVTTSNAFQNDGNLYKNMVITKTIIKTWSCLHAEYHHIMKRKIIALCSVLLVPMLTVGSIQRNPMALALAGDFAGPVVVSYTFSPTTIDISNSSADVVVTARVTDASGVKTAPIIYIQNNAQVTATQQTGYFVRTSGTAQDGIYSKTITIPRGKQPGQWSVFSNAFFDTEGNGSGRVSPDNDQTLTVVNTGGICPIVTTTTVSVSVPVPVTSTTAATKPILTMKKTLSAKSLATYTGLKIVTGSTVSMTVNATSRTICRVSGTTLKAVKKGTCKVVVTVKSRTGKKSSKNLTINVRS